MKDIQSDIVYFPNLAKVKARKAVFGSQQLLLEKWGASKTTAWIIHVKHSINLGDIIPPRHECVFLVQSGIGKIGNRLIRSGYAAKLLPDSEALISPRSPMKIFMVYAPRQRKDYPSNAKRIEVLDVNKVPIKPYEITSYAQEVFAPNYEKTLGLKTFQFPVREIPRHVHPHSDRIILVAPKSEGGWTEAGGKIYPMVCGSMCAFGRKTVHTNGPAHGKNYVVFAFQLPHVFSGITEKNVRGVPKFVTYVGEIPPKKVWANKKDLENLKEKLRGNFGE